MCRVRRLLPYLGVLLLLPACSSGKGFAEKEVSRADYGAKWPLTTDDGLIGCEPGNVLTFTTNGRTYGLQRVSAGIAVPAGFRRIWAHDASSGARRDLSPLVDDARELCD